MYVKTLLLPKNLANEKRGGLCKTPHAVLLCRNAPPPLHHATLLSCVVEQHCQHAGHIPRRPPCLVRLLPVADVLLRLGYDHDRHMLCYFFLHSYGPRVFLLPYH